MGRRQQRLPSDEEAKEIVRLFENGTSNLNYSRLAEKSERSEEAVRRVIFICRILADGYARPRIPVNLEPPLVRDVLFALRAQGSRARAKRAKAVDTGETWTTREGQVLPIREMTIDHLRNASAMLARMLREHRHGLIPCDAFGVPDGLADPCPVPGWQRKLSAMQGELAHRAEVLSAWGAI